MGFESKWNILNRQIVDVEKSELDIADMWLISLDHVTYCHMNATKSDLHFGHFAGETILCSNFFCFLLFLAFLFFLYI